MFGPEFMCESMMAVFTYLTRCHTEKGPHFLRDVSEGETSPLTRAVVSHFRSMSKQ